MRFIILLLLLGISSQISVNYAIAETVIATIPVDTDPYDIAVNSITNKIYVTDSYSKFISVIDGATNTVTGTIPAELFHDSTIAVNPTTNTIYVANEHTVSVIDGATNTVTGTIPVDQSHAPHITVNPTTNTIYVTNTQGTVSVIDGATNTVTSTIPIGDNVRDVAVNPTTNTIYVVDTFDVEGVPSGTLRIIDGTTNTVTTTISPLPNPGTIAINPTTNTIYLTNYYDSSVSVIDGTTNTVTTTIEPVNFYRPFGMVVNPDTNTIYIAGVNGPVFVIDGATNTVTTTIEDAYWVSGGSIAINPTTNTIYNAHKVDGKNPGSSPGFISVIGTDIISPIVIPPQNVIFKYFDTIPKATATDNVGVISIICNPNSESKFAIGITTVTCTATDKAGNTGSSAYTVTVVPPPILSNVIDITIDAVSDTDTKANYPIPTITGDKLYQNLSVKCSPVQNTVIPIGTTNVKCDAYENEKLLNVSTSFDILVNPPKIFNTSNQTISKNDSIKTCGVDTYLVNGVCKIRPDLIETSDVQITSAEPKILDTNNERVSVAHVGETLFVGVEIENLGDSTEDFVASYRYLASSIGDWSEWTWVSSSINAGKTSDVAIPWNPTVSDNYEFDIQIWDNVQDRNIITSEKLITNVKSVSTTNSSTIQETSPTITKSTVIEPKQKLSFVDESKDPQSYIDRYNNEPEYKAWFNSNYPDYTIYEAVGVTQPIPGWIKNTASWWSDGSISEDEFLKGIKFLVEKRILNVN